jgi:copper chaperone CopZ
LGITTVFSRRRADPAQARVQGRRRPSACQEERMQELVAVVPDLWADHHVVRARAAALDLPGVEHVDASARDLTVRVAYDPARTDEGAIVAALTAAGYPPGEPAASETHRDKAAWTSGPRVTTTNEADLSMSGDYRKY